MAAAAAAATAATGREEEEEEEGRGRRPSLATMGKQILSVRRSWLGTPRLRVGTWFAERLADVAALEKRGLLVRRERSICEGRENGEGFADRNKEKRNYEMISQMREDGERQTITTTQK